jgi:hypothetical protein
MMRADARAADEAAGRHDRVGASGNGAVKNGPHFPSRSGGRQQCST